MKKWEDLSAEEQARFREIIKLEGELIGQKEELEEKLNKLDKEKELMRIGKWHIKETAGSAVK